MYFFQSICTHYMYVSICFEFDEFFVVEFDKFCLCEEEKIRRKKRGDEQYQ